MKIACAALIATLVALPMAARPSDTGFDLGVRVSITAADGEPANDIPGVGAASDDVPDVSGARADGGQFVIHTEADTEIIASVLGGVRRTFGKRWYGEFGLRVDQHFADWRFEDRVSGASGTVDDYLAIGGHVAAGFRF